jgi:hypothetical protein
MTNISSDRWRGWLGLGLVLLMALGACTPTIVLKPNDKGQWAFQPGNKLTRCQACDPGLMRDASLGKNCVCADPRHWKTAGCAELKKLDPPLCTGISFGGKVTERVVKDRVELIVAGNAVCPILEFADGTRWETPWCMCTGPEDRAPDGKYCY